MKQGLETIDFYPQTFQAIPQPDNPAYGEVIKECMMIVKDMHNEKTLVLHIEDDPDDTVTQVAAFWRHERAKAYCELVTQGKQSGVSLKELRAIKGAMDAMRSILDEYKLISREDYLLIENAEYTLFNAIRDAETG